MSRTPWRLRLLQKDADCAILEQSGLPESRYTGLRRGSGAHRALMGAGAKLPQRRGRTLSASPSSRIRKSTARFSRRNQRRDIHVTKRRIAFEGNDSIRNRWARSIRIRLGFRLRPGASRSDQGIALDTASAPMQRSTQVGQRSSLSDACSCCP